MLGSCCSLLTSPGIIAPGSFFTANFYRLKFWTFRGLLKSSIGTVASNHCADLTASAKRFNCHRASIAKIGRKLYVRMYPTLLVNPDGSTITIRAKEPRKIIKLPVDLNTLNDEERRFRLAERLPAKEIRAEERLDVKFDAKKYDFIWKKNKAKQ